MPSVTLSFPRVLASVQVYPRTTLEVAFNELVRADPSLAYVVRLAGGPSAVFPCLLIALQESIRENNQDKRYFLQRLQQYNAAAAQLAQYLDQLVDASQDLATAEKDTPYRCKSKADASSWLPFSDVTLRLAYSGSVKST
jgi:hypothetical protein